MDDPNYNTQCSEWFAHTVCDRSLIMDMGNLAIIITVLHNSDKPQASLVDFCI